MEIRFGYKRDKRCKRLTAVYLLLLSAILSVIIFMVDFGYMEAWLLTVLGAVLALYILSIPRYVKVDDEFLEIHCIVEMTRIDLRDIVAIRRAEPGEYSNRLICTLGSYGFFGYFGYYLDLKEWDFIKVYATQRRNLVLIEDIYEQKYIVSCREADRLIATAVQARAARQQEG
ncbi:MAG: PH domain-containing protein [Rikenellaceae bacterium]|nr:PH domain-containing protein [Rikenellaceae bacterium]